MDHDPAVNLAECIEKEGAFTGRGQNPTSGVSMRRQPEAAKLLKTSGAGSSESGLSCVVLKRTARVLPEL